MYRKLANGIIAVAINLSLCISLAQAENVTIIDTEGRSVEAPMGAKRILLGFYFEDFYAIGGPDAYENVVAISRAVWQGWRQSQWKQYSKKDSRLEKLIDVGEVDSGTFSVETAIAAKPDVAIFAAWQFRSLGNSIDKLEEAGIPVVVIDYNAQTLEKHVTSTQILGKITNNEKRAEQLATEYSNAVQDVWQRVKKAGGDPKRVYVELGNKGSQEYGNTYSNTMWAGVVQQAGGKNIGDGQVEKWGPLNPEYVIASNPQAIFIAGSDWVGKSKAVLMGFDEKPEVTRARLQPYVERAGWNNFEGVKNGEVHALYHGGARTLYDYTFLQYIAKVLHPEAFLDVDPSENHRQFYEKYLPIDANGVFMIKLEK